jgi:pimeloyl-ACP methyl ester carboxylesterase
MDQMASDVRALMSALEIEEAILVGLSMGGYVALAFYRNYPGAVRAMVLADTRASADTAESRARRLKAAEKAVREGASAIADDILPMLLGRSTIESRPEVVSRVRSMIDANDPNGIAAAQRGMAHRPDSTYILAGINCPVAILVGSEDVLTPVSEAEALRNGIPHSTMRVIQGAGHLPNIEDPAQFNSAVSEFIRGLKKTDQ